MTEAKTGERTAGPWIIQDERDMTGEIWIGVEHPEVGFVSHASVRSGCGEADELGDMEANAAFIVQACNAFPALIARIEELERALRPFADLIMPHQEPDHWPAFGKSAGQGFPTVGDFRRARELVSDKARSALEAALKTEGR